MKRRLSVTNFSSENNVLITCLFSKLKLVTDDLFIYAEFESLSVNICTCTAPLQPERYVMDTLRKVKSRYEVFSVTSFTTRDLSLCTCVLQWAGGVSVGDALLWCHRLSKAAWHLDPGWNGMELSWNRVTCLSLSHCAQNGWEIELSCRCLFFLLRWVTVA